MWHNRLIAYLLKEWYRNGPICFCIYMKISKNEFVIIIVYVNDINIVGTLNELTKAIDCLKKEFEMKDLEKAKFLFEITNWVFKQRCFFIYQEAYIIKVRKNVLNGQVTSIMHANSCEIVRCW